MAGGDRGSTHPSLAALNRFLLGELSPRESAPVVAHLLTGCRRCCEQMAPLAAVVLAPGAEPPELPAGSTCSEYDFPLFRAFANARRYAEVLEREREEKALESCLSVVPPPAPRTREDQVLRDGVRCEAYLERCRALRHSDPEALQMLASMAVTLAERIPLYGQASKQVHDLRARAWAELGNACRVSGDLAGAEERLCQALQSADQGSGDQALLIYLMDLAASLLIDQRRFPEAFQLLDQIEQIHRAGGNLHAAGRTLVIRGIAAGHALDTDGAIRLLGESLRLIDPCRDPKLVLAAIHNLLSFLVEAGRLGEAGRLLSQSRDLYAACAERLDRFKVRWLEGFIAAEQGDDRTAEAAYCEVRAGFEEAELPYDAALVSLDLAAVWLRQGRTREIQGMIDEMVAIFRARNIRREAIGALLMLREACEREGATAALLRSVASEIQSEAPRQGRL